jgi:predicted dehydrogenase
MTVELRRAREQLLRRCGRRIRLGMVGGGSDSVIGETHRVALRADGLCELVAGAMSIVPEIARESARMNLISEDRIYTDFRVMAGAEGRRDDRIDAVVIATPPQTHFEIAQAFLGQGIDVICEKPMTATAEEAAKLVSLVEASGRILVLTHCYTGYPMVRQARSTIRAGSIGRVTLIEAEFCAGDPGVAREPSDRAKRHWRFRPESMGKAAILGEVGSHAHNIASYVTGANLVSVSARLDTVAANRDVYDNAYLTTGWDNGAVGRIWSSYVAIGNEHGLSFRIFGEDGALAWRQEEPEVLWLQRLGKPTCRLTRGLDELSRASLAATRFRPGHPEGYALAFANLYKDYAYARLSELLGEDRAPYLEHLPDAHAGLAVMQVIKAAERSHSLQGAIELVTQREIGARDNSSSRDLDEDPLAVHDSHGT